MRFIKPLDEKAIMNSAQKNDLIITVEDNSVMGRSWKRSKMKS